MNVDRNPPLIAGCARSGGAVLIAAMLGLLPAAAVAQDQATREAPPASAPRVVRVTAGEHGDFSRVVLNLGAVVGYRAAPEPGGLRVVFPGTRLQFDYRESELTRQARRVTGAHADIGSADTSFVLRFDCACTPRTAAYDGKVVIDVFDAPGAEPRRPSARAAATGPAAPALATGASAGSADGATPRPEFMRRVEDLADPPPARRDAPATGASFDAEQLRRLLAQAIEDGHLSAEGSAAARATLDGPAPATPPVVEQAAPRAHDERTPTDGAACPDGKALDPAIGFGTGAFSAELARRQDLLGRALEAGEGVEQAQLALASFYLARLMPQEALATLTELTRKPANPATVAWLKAAALALAERPQQIAESGRDPGCAGADIAVWHATIAAARGPVPKAVLEAPGLAARVAAYPGALRVELGLRLARAGLDAGVPDLAAQLIELVAATGPDGAAHATLLFLKGRLAALRGDFAGARRAWQGAARLPGEGGARARLALLRADLESEAPVTSAAHALLARLAFDWRGHPLQLEVAELAAALHERDGRPLDALDALDQVALGAPGRPKAGAAARLATDLLRRLYADPARAVPAEQLAVFWRYEGFVPPGQEGDDIRLGFARALLAHDLPGPAADLLAPLTRAAPAALRVEAIEQLAEARLRLAQPELALDLLRAGTARLQQPRPGWNLLAARALADLGRFAEAAGVLHDEPASGPAPAEQADYLWRAGLWAEAVPVFAARFRQAADGGDEAAAAQAATRAVAAAYMAGNPAARLAAHTDLQATAGPAAAALIAGPPGGAGPRARLPALLEQAAAVVRLARAHGVEG